MRNSKLVEILSAFSKDEVKSFEKFIISPYFAIGRDLSGLWGILKKNFPEFSENAMDKEKVFQKLFPGETFNEKKLKNLSSDLIKLAEQFMVINEIRNNSADFNKSLAAQYKKRKNQKNFLRSLKASEDELKNKLFNSVDCFAQEENICWQKIDYHTVRNEFEEAFKLRAVHTDLVTASFLIRFFRRLNDRKAIESYNLPLETPLINTVIRSTDFDLLVRELEDNNSDFGILVKLYYYAYKSNNEIDNKSFYPEFKKLFYENISKFSSGEKYMLFNDLANCCALQRDAGNHEFGPEQLEVYKHQLKTSAYLSEGEAYLSVVLYRNILFIALVLSEFRWLDSFINDYTDKLHPDFRENMKNHALAHSSFEQKQFENGLKFLSKVGYDFFIYKLDVKQLLLKIYYELSLFDQAYSLIDTYRHFLRESNEVSEFHKRWHDGFLQIYSKLLKMKSSKQSEGAELLLFELSKIKYVIANKWLKTKIEELI